MKTSCSIAVVFLAVSTAQGVSNAVAQHLQSKHQTDEAVCPVMKPASEDMKRRGDQQMGFSQERTTHHFLLTSTGGAIQVETKNTADTIGRDQIRQHLRQITVRFADGDFSVPAAVHAQVPPGASELKHLKEKLSYVFEETPQGGRVRITSTDPDAIAAVHDFLRFQITEHETGDPLEVR